MSAQEKASDIEMKPLYKTHLEADINETKDSTEMNKLDIQRTDGKSSSEGASDKPSSILSTVIALLSTIVPSGGMISTIFSVAATSVGSGIMGLPAAFNSTGIIIAIVYLIVITAETVYSMRLLAQTAEKTKLRSYEELSVLLHPKAYIVVSILRMLSTLSGTIAFVVTLGDLLKPILESIDGTPSFLLKTTGHKLLQIGFWLVFMFPFAFPRKFNTLRYASIFGISFMFYLIIVIILHYFMHGFKADPPAHTNLANTGNTALDGMGIFIFVYMCQINCLEIYFEMTKRSIKRFTLCISISLIFCGLLYFATGLFGYLDFGDAVTGSILHHYNPIKEPQIFVCYVGIFFKICVSFGLLNNTCRCALFSLIDWDPQAASTKKHIIGSVGLAFLALILGIAVPNITIVFALSGGILGGSIGFMLPALFIMYSGNWSLKSVGVINYVCTYLVLLGGVAGLVFSTGSSLYSTFR
ncbi:unnamed protein product [Phytomonas sp. EM1]|nr:unnamed protein product [Phytomonas sp. EM1]|eukprot:CCW65204.1 unnamed protein product [Phytomonas sp. isolate EM1]